MRAPSVEYAGPGKKAPGMRMSDALARVDRLGMSKSSPVAVKMRATPQIHKASRRAVRGLTPQPPEIELEWRICPACPDPDPYSGFRRGGSHPSGRRASPPFLGEAAGLPARSPGNRLEQEARWLFRFRQRVRRFFGNSAPASSRPWRRTARRLP